MLEEKINIEDMIYEINGVEVMLDSDLAELYNCKNGTKEINQAVKNNPDKFPKKYLFKITDEEFNSLKSKYFCSRVMSEVYFPYKIKNQEVQNEPRR